MTHFEYFINSHGNRDNIFKFVLEKLNQKPARILEIGVARDLNRAARKSDGWSSMHFGQYISKYNGHLDLVDVSEESLKNCEQLISTIPNFINYSKHLIDGREFLKTAQNYDLILLDGSDDPGEMLTCFELAKDKTQYIFCDDFHTKGSLLRQKYPNFILFKWPGSPHEMAFYDTINWQSSVMQMEHLEQIPDNV